MPVHIKLIRDNSIDEPLLDHQKHYKTLQETIKQSASFKMGYPESMMSSLYGHNRDGEITIDPNSATKLINNKVLGIAPNSLAELLILNVGNPWKESESFAMEAKHLERDVIELLGGLFGLPPDQSRGYVTSGGTEANLACLWWCRQWLAEQADGHLKSLRANLEMKRLALSLIMKTDQGRARLDIHLDYLLAKTKLAEADKPLVFFTADHTHYSIQKLCHLMQLDTVLIGSNESGQMNIQELAKTLDLHVREHPHRSIILVANIGSTVTGAIDDLRQIKCVMDKFTNNGLTTRYAIHCDAALYGMALPITKPFGPIGDYFRDLGIDTMTLSGHKLLGTAVCGVALTTRSFMDSAFLHKKNIVEYCGNIDDITIAGCRPGLSILWLHNTLHSLNLRETLTNLKAIVDSNLRHAEDLYHELANLLGYDEVAWIPEQFNVIFRRPSPELIKKYSLMPAAVDRAVACVLTNVTNPLIAQFLRDYSQESLRREHAQSDAIASQ